MIYLELFARVVACEKTPGHVVEVGVASGKSILILREIFPKDRMVFGYDTFNGMPKVALEPGEEHLEGIGSKTSPRTPFELTAKGIYPVVGVFPYTIEETPDRFPGHICFAHIDVDNFSTTDAALNRIWPRLSNKGVIALHDYANPATPGVKKAISHFLLTVDKAISFETPGHFIIRRENGLEP